MKNSGLILLFITFGVSLLGQHPALQSGPMLGYCEMREVLLWVQLSREGEVYFTYRAEGENQKTFRTKIEQASARNAYIVKAVADSLEPGTGYEYQLYIDGEAVGFEYPLKFRTQVLWQYRTDPPAIRFAAGSCFFDNEEQYDRPGKPYGRNYQILNSIHEDEPEFMMWLGDNTYLREVDFYSRSGIYHRYTHARSMPEMQPLLAGMHHYAIWDDHDYGPNNSNRSYSYKKISREAFEDFWGNNVYGVDGTEDISGFFRWGDIDFFLLDDRYHRSPNHLKTGSRTILGQEQINWLIDALSSSNAPFKFVCMGGQFLNDAELYENYINVAPDERQEIIDRIQKENIRGVVFLTGDRHHSELSEYRPESGNPIWDLTVSPLTSGAYDASDEPNSLRISGTQYGLQNYSILEVSGPRKERELTIEVFDADGKSVWKRKINSDYEVVKE